MHDKDLFESDSYLFRPFNEAMHRANVLWQRALDGGNADLAAQLEQYQHDLTHAYLTLVYKQEDHNNNSPSDN